ncbi:MAG: DUF1254 domain-containing protein [Thermomicrobiales bacterium]|nr:DUF1254 domain-containing protein [Thermomicrobiales bacterium]
MSTIQPALSDVDTRAIAKDAYIYGFPIVDNYRILYSYFVDVGGPEYKTSWNTIFNNARVYTPDDTAIQTPNSDTPYSYVGADLRAEPLVLTVPPNEKDRYYSLQFIDLYTFNFAYVGSRATGNGGGHYLLAGPSWQEETPDGIDAVIRCETELALVFYRTQLFNPDDIEQVKQIQAGYQVQPLSTFLGNPAPSAAPAIAFLKPLSIDDERTSLTFFEELNFLLQFCPVVPAETDLRQRFATLGIAAGVPFDAASVAPNTRQAIQSGMADAWAALDDQRKNVEIGTVTAGDLFGTRDYLNGNYLNRMTGAVLGIYGNSKDEALYPAYILDAARQPLDGSHRYTLRFASGQLPPVNAFWSLTMYTVPQSLLYANPINRYLINSSMLPNLVMDADGGLTIFVQHESPGADKEVNWLPSPAGPFQMAMRLYWPQEAALDGTWTAPPLEQAH